MSKSVDLQGQELWAGFIDSIRQSLSNHVIQTWFEPALCVGSDGSTIQLAVRDSFARDWLSNHYLAFIRDGLTRFTGNETVIELLVVPELFLNTDNEDTPLDDIEEPEATNLLLAPEATPSTKICPYESFANQLIQSETLPGNSMLVIYLIHSFAGLQTNLHTPRQRP